MPGRMDRMTAAAVRILANHAATMDPDVRRDDGAGL
jgi:hypothetical protein